MRHPVQELLKLMRPRQWWKNSFVFVGVGFSQHWMHFPTFVQALWCASAFCLVSSSVYILNDLVDRQSDRLHPRKRQRPLAAGTVHPSTAALLAVVLGGAGLVIGADVGREVLGLMGLYIVINIAYSLKLKHVVIIDAFAISSGFILRVLVGTVGLGINPSQWLLLCTIMLTLFLAFTKRRAESLTADASDSESGRRVLEQYTPELLDNLISVTATGAILSYSLYTTNPLTIELHQTEHLIVTVPFVTYGIFRCMYLLHRWRIGERPASDLLADKHVIAAAVAWVAVTIALLAY